MKFDFEDDFLLLENDQGLLELLSFHELQRNFVHQKKSFIDLLILSTRNGCTLLPFFIDLGIANIIYFDFKTHNEDGLLKHMQDICLNGFSEKFYSEYFRTGSIGESFRRARDFIVSKTYGKYCKLFQDLSSFQETLGNGPMLYPFPTSKQNLSNFILEEVNSPNALNQKDFIESGEVPLIDNVKVDVVDSKKIRKSLSQGNLFFSFKEIYWLWRRNRLGAKF